jgi:non-ribosomal peptide synthetase component F
VIVNQAHCFAAGGNFDNALPFSLSMGCGTWGNNITDENLNYKHYLNITKVVETIKSTEPSEDDIFSSYWKKYSLTPSTITELIDQHAKNTPDKTFLIDADLDLNVSYRQLKKDIAVLGIYFYQNGIQFQDKVGFLLDNSYASTLLFIGAMYHGITIVPINVLAGNKQIKYTINHSGCKLLFSSKLYLNEFEKLIVEHEEIISKTINIEPIKNRLFSDYQSGVVKSLGAWGGDFVLVTGNKSSLSYFSNKGYNEIIPYKDLVY